MASGKQHGRAIVGIDPGTTGAIAVLGYPGTVAMPMPKFASDAWRLADRLAQQLDSSPVVFVEKVHGGPAMNSRTAFVFGRSYGIALMIAHRLSEDVRMVTPSTWQNELNLITSDLAGLSHEFGKDESIKKNINRTRAARLYPDASGLNKQTADAVLLAHYGKVIIEKNIRGHKRRIAKLRQVKG